MAAPSGKQIAAAKKSEGRVSCVTSPSASILVGGSWNECF